MNKRSKIFLSYAHTDSIFALRVKKELENAGFFVWIDKHHIPIGESWHKKVQAAIESCSIMLVILSPESVESNYVSSEYSFAIDLKVKVIPVLYKTCDIPFLLKQIQYVDFRSDFLPPLETLLNNIDPPALPKKREKTKSIFYKKRKQKITGLKKNTIIIVFFLISSFSLLLGILEVFSIDSRTEALIMWVGDQFSDKNLSSQIKLVTFSRKSSESNEEWRIKHSKMIRTFSKFGAKVIAFDLTFPSEYKDVDNILSDSIKFANKDGTTVIVGYKDLLRSTCFNPIISSKIKNSGAILGFVDISKRNGSVRTSVLAIKKETCKKTLYSLPLYAYFYFKDYNEIKLIQTENLSNSFTSSHIILLENTETGNQNIIPLNEYKIVSKQKEIEETDNIQNGDYTAEIFFDFSELKFPNRIGRCIGILNNCFTYQDILKNINNSTFGEIFRDKIVIIGESRKGDFHRIYQGLGEPRLGVELHADVINSLIKKEYIIIANIKWQIFLLLVVIVTGIKIKSSPSKYSFYLLMTIMFFLLIASVYIYIQYKIIIYILYHILTILSSYIFYGLIHKEIRQS